MEKEDFINARKTMKNIGTNGKIALAVSFVVLAVTTFVSFVDAGFDPTKINWIDWLAMMAMNEAIAFVMMFAGETFYISYCSTKEDGKYQSSLSNYLDAREAVGDKTEYLGQYLRAVHDSEVRNADLNYLIDHGIENAKRVLLLDIQDIPKLKNPFKKVLADGTVIELKSYTKAQIKTIRHVLEGGVNIRRMSKAFYLDKDNKTSGSTDYQQAGHIGDEIKIVKGVGRIAKALSLVMISALMAGITVKEFADGADAQTWYNLVSRITAAIGGFWAGCRTSFHVNEIECRALSLKTTMLSEYAKFIAEKPDHFKMTDEEFEASEAVHGFEVETTETETKGEQNERETHENQDTQQCV